MSLIIRTTGWSDYMDPAGGSWVKELILGNPDVGKTRSASFWPKPIFADCEDGRMSLADREVPYARVRSSSDMDALIRELQFDNKRAPEKRKYQTLVLDTIDKFQKHLITEKLAREGKERLTGWADWGWLDGVMQSYVQQLLNLEMNVVVNCHYKVVTSDDDESTAKALGQVLRLKGDVKEWLIEEFDLIGMMESYYASEDGKRTRKRRIRWHNEPAFPLLKDRSGSLPQFTEVDFTDEDYTRIFEALMSRVDSLPESATIDEIETFLEDPAEPAPANLEGGPVDPGPLPAKKVAAKKAVAKKAPAKVRDAAPGEAVVHEVQEKGKKAEPVVVDANKAHLENYSHAHAKDGTCLRNLWGPECHAGETDSGAEGSGNPAPEKDSASEASTDVPKSEESGPADPLPTPDEAVANVAEALGGKELDESQLPEKYCGKQPATHTKFPKAPGCGKDLKDEIPAKINLHLLRAKTMLCTTCFTEWKTAQEANLATAKN